MSTQRMAKGIKATLPSTPGQALHAIGAKRRVRLGPKPAKPRNGAEKSVPDADPQIEIRLDTAVTAGPIQDRYDVEVVGEVLAERPIRSVSLVVDGVSRASFLFGQSASGRQSFSLVHAERETARLELTPIEIEARTDDGYVRRTAFSVAAGLNGVDVPRVVDGPVRDIQSPPLAATPVRLYVETAAFDRQGVLHVVGWSVALFRIVAINIFVDDRLVGTTEANRRGTILAEVSQPIPMLACQVSRFQQPFPTTRRPKLITVEAIDLSGTVSRTTVPVDHGADKVPGCVAC